VPFFRRHTNICDTLHSITSLISNFHQDGESSRTHIAVRDGILRKYGETKIAVAMERTGTCKITGKCDVFHVALFFPTLTARRNAYVMQLLCFRSKSTLAEI
jgi:hypothetical protein